MEDGDITEPEIEPGISLFAIFDGHGGDEMAKFSEIHFTEELKKNENFKNKNW